MTAKREQHFVPKFYLRRFASDPPKRRRVHVYRIEARAHVENASIRDQCASPYFYGKDGELEEAFSHLEGAAATVLRTMVESSRVPLPFTDDCAVLLRFIVLQLCRTPRSVERLNAQLERFTRATLSTHPEGPEKFGEAFEHVRVKWRDPVGASLETYRFALVLHDLRAMLLHNTTKRHFITSDTAVVLHNHWARKAKGIGALGFASSGLQVFLPLSPDCCAVLFDRAVYEPVGIPSTDLIEVTTTADVDRINSLQMAWAHKNLYYACPSSARDIDALPHDLWGPPDQHVHIETRRQEDRDHSHLILTTYEMARVELALSCLPIRYEAGIVPHWQRASQWRREATALGDRLTAKRDAARTAARGPRPARQPGAKSKRHRT